MQRERAGPGWVYREQLSSSHKVTAVSLNFPPPLSPASLLSILGAWEILWRVQDVLRHSKPRLLLGRDDFGPFLKTFFSKLLKLLIRPDLYDIWVNQRT